MKQRKAKTRCWGLRGWAVATLILFSACSLAQSSDREIRSYEECIEAGFPMMKSMPPKCSSGDGRVFTRGIAVPHQVPSIQEKDPIRPSDKRVCQNRCGNGRCEEMVCQALGCPCAETPITCPQDCAR